MQLRTLLDWEIVPKLRGVAGVIEVNTMGGDLKEYQVVVDRGRLHAHEMPLGAVADALARSNLNVGGGYLEEISNVVLRTSADGVGNDNTDIFVRLASKSEWNPPPRLDARGARAAQPSADVPATMTLPMSPEGDRIRGSPRSRP